MGKKVNNLIKEFERFGIDCFLITDNRGVKYFSGFTGSNGLCLISKNERYFITDFRYQEQVKKEVLDFKILISDECLFEQLKKDNLIGDKKTGFEANRITFKDYQDLLKFIPYENFIPIYDVIDKLISVKDDEEIKNIRRAAEMGDRVFDEIIFLIKPGIKEIELSAEISYRSRKYGSQKDAFEPIVVSGVKSAMPHGKPDGTKLKKGEIVLLDFGCVYNGYHSDMTRTLFIGKPDKKIKKIYKTVLEAQKLGIESVREGIECNRLDSVVRKFINGKGFGKYFGHASGHGVGLEIHEMPRISKQNKNALLSRNVITIEPGIYIPNLGGVRIEDDVVVNRNGCTVLTSSPKDLICL